MNTVARRRTKQGVLLWGKKEGSFWLSFKATLFWGYTLTKTHPYHTTHPAESNNTVVVCAIDIAKPSLLLEPRKESPNSA